MAMLTEAQRQAAKHWVERINQGELTTDPLSFVEEFKASDLPDELKLDVMAEQFSKQNYRRYNKKYSIGHFCASGQYGSDEAAQSFLHYLISLLPNKKNAKKILAILKLQTIHGRTIGHLIVRNRDSETVKLYLNLVDQLRKVLGNDAIIELLDLQDNKCDRTVGHEIHFYESDSTIITLLVLLNKLHTTENMPAFLKLLSREDETGETLGYLISYAKDVFIIKIYLKMLKTIQTKENEQAIIALMQLRGEDGWSFLEKLSFDFDVSVQFQLLSDFTLSEHDYKHFDKERIYQFMMNLIKNRSLDDQEAFLSLIAENQQSPLAQFFLHKGLMPETRHKKNVEGPDYMQKIQDRIDVIRKYHLDEITKNAIRSAMIAVGAAEEKSPADDLPTAGNQQDISSFLRSISSVPWERRGNNITVKENGLQTSSERKDFNNAKRKN